MKHIKTLLLSMLMAAPLTTLGQDESAYDWYRLITQTSDFEDGMECLIASCFEANNDIYVMLKYVPNAEFCMSELVTNNLIADGMIPVSKATGQLTTNAHVVAARITMERGDHVWHFRSDEAGVYYSTPGEKDPNFKARSCTPSGNETFTIYAPDTNGNVSIACWSKMDNYYLLYAYTPAHFTFSNSPTTTRPVRLYRKLTGHYLRDITMAKGDDHKYGTLCLPYAVSDVSGSGATYYEVAGTVAASGGGISGIMLREVTSLEARKPYIFRATGKLLHLPEGEVVEGDALSSTGMVGNLGEQDVTVPQGKYLISGNELHLVDGDNAKIARYRAYIDLTGVSEYHASSATPSAKLVPLRLQGADGDGAATAIRSAATAPAAARAVYNAAGQRAEQSARGLLIEGGRKVSRR